MNVKLLAIAGIATSLLASAPAWGAAISVNYDTALSSTLAVTGPAGVVVAANWNNISSTGPGGFLAPTQTFVDDSAASTSLTVGVSNGATNSWNTNYPSQDKTIYGDWLAGGNATTLSLSSIPYAAYDLYIYHSHWGTHTITYTIGGNVQSLTGSGNPGTEPIHRLNDSYVKFTGLTAANINVGIVKVSGEGIGLAGFQIVQVPEPSILGLLALAPALAFRRRRA